MRGEENSMMKFWPTFWLEIAVSEVFQQRRVDVSL
jgi:hypothetical protein